MRWWRVPISPWHVLDLRVLALYIPIAFAQHWGMRLLTNEMFDRVKNGEL